MFWSFYSSMGSQKVLMMMMMMWFNAMKLRGIGECWLETKWQKSITFVWLASLIVFSSNIYHSHLNSKSRAHLQIILWKWEMSLFLLQAFSKICLSHFAELPLPNDSFETKRWMNELFIFSYRCNQIHANFSVHGPPNSAKHLFFFQFCHQSKFIQNNSRLRVRTYKTVSMVFLFAALSLFWFIIMLLHECEFQLEL